ncbi:alpha/beta hydrolase family protein [Janibacter limosus]|uniref:alpha/beta hydrolase family protein n=1 Tax=Janibacter limosus TaxID=53458 RepID=UPI00082A38D8|nr:prolyl oligopeptidase family serine peptidase [Janibacter limosus]
MIDEDAALHRLLDEGSTLAFPMTAYGPHPDQVFETCAPQVDDLHAHGSDAPRTRTLVVVHGGYFRPAIDRTHARPMAQALVQAGWHVVLTEYRRVPGDPSTTTDDLTALDTHLRETGHDVAAWVGHSAGGALVMWRALHQHLPPTRALALAPVADFGAAVADRLGSNAVRDWIGADPHQSPDLYARLDPTRLLAVNPAAAQRISILHGGEDATVPLRQTLGWVRTVLDGAHHFDVIDPASPHWPSVLAALTQR